MDFVTSTVSSADGTTIGIRTCGAGPALVVVPGNNRMAHDYDRLASALADTFTVCVVERRGRGVSGPQGADYSLDKEVEDLQTVFSSTGAHLVFGHSFGGLVALSAARTDRRIRRLAVYEPGVSIDGSFDLSFRHEFGRLLSRGKHVRAMALFLHASQLLPFEHTSYPVCWAFAVLMVGRRTEMRDLMATTPAELEVLAASDSDGSPYAAVTAETLLLSGAKSPSFLTAVLTPLSAIIPRARHEVLADADHNAPDESAPERIAAELRTFFTGAERELRR